MENRAGSIEVFYAARPEDEVVLVLDETSNFAYHFESEEAARKAYPGVIFEMEQVDLLGVKLLTMFPPELIRCLRWQGRKFYLALSHGRWPSCRRVRQSPKGNTVKFTRSRSYGESDRRMKKLKNRK